MSREAAAERRSIPWKWLLMGAVLLWAIANQDWSSGSSHPLLGRVAPAFTLPVAGPSGDRQRLADLRGSVVLLDFWATWCGACRASTPTLNKIHKRYQERGLHLIGINTDMDQPVDAAAGHRAFRARFPSLLDPGRQAQSAFKVEALPTLVLIDREGKIRWVEAGVPDLRRLSARIVELL